MTAATSVVIIQDNNRVREGLVAVLRKRPDFAVLAASADVDEALLLVRAAKPDVVLVAATLGDHNPLVVIRSLCVEIPDAYFIVIDVLPFQSNLAEFVRAGVTGFVLQGASLETSLGTIQRVASGGSVLPSELAGAFFRQLALEEFREEDNKFLGASTVGAVRLTRRERDLVGMIGDASTDEEIAAQLNVTVNTVRRRLHKVVERIARHSRLEVASMVPRTSAD